jgi:hypothetical protein
VRSSSSGSQIWTSVLLHLRRHNFRTNTNNITIYSWYYVARYCSLGNMIRRKCSRVRYIIPLSGHYYTYIQAKHTYKQNYSIIRKEHIVCCYSRHSPSLYWQNFNFSQKKEFWTQLAPGYDTAIILFFVFSLNRISAEKWNMHRTYYTRLSMLPLPYPSTRNVAFESKNFQWC